MNLFHPMYYVNQAKGLYQFLLRPTSHITTQQSIPEKLKGTWAMFVVKLALTIILGISIAFFDEPSNNTTAHHNTLSPFRLFLVVSILSSLEEVAFRLSLKFKPIYLAFTSSVFTYYFMSSVVYDTRLSNTTDNFDMRVLASLLVFISIFSLFKLPTVAKTLERLWTNHFRWVLYGFCFIFGSIHLMNYNLSLSFAAFFFVTLLSKSVNAFCYSYVRINYGFVYSIGLHLLWNGFGLMMNMLSSGSGD